jgi:hypothetical protein
MRLSLKPCGPPMSPGPSNAVPVWPRCGLGPHEVAIWETSPDGQKAVVLANKRTREMIERNRARVTTQAELLD